MEKLVLYKPLIVIACMAVLTASALAITGRVPVMDGLMGMFLCLLALVKFFNLPGFASLFSKYDPLAARVKIYGSLYPLIELGLGLFYLAGLAPLFTNVALIIILLASTIGILKTIRSGISVRCGCVGADFALPVGWVTVFENLVMMTMATANILR